MTAATIRATEDIYLAPGVLAFRKGDIVPASAAKHPAAEGKTATERTKAVATAVQERIKEG